MSTKTETEDDTNEMNKTVATAITDEFGDLHSIQITQKTEKATWILVTHTTEVDAVPHEVVEIATAAVDNKSGKIRKNEENSMWVPRDGDILAGLIQSHARTQSDVTGSVDPDTPPLTMSHTSAEDIDGLFSRAVDTQEHATEQNVKRMENDPGISPDRPWGYGSGAPPEISEAINKIRNAGIQAPSSRFIRLKWGSKVPFNKRMNGDLRRGIHREDLAGNYGICPAEVDDGLLVIDIDDREAFPESVELPETWMVSSPHGDDSHGHLYLRCRDKQAVAEFIGDGSAQWVAMLDWGEVYLSGRYSVGPGSQLSAYGCTAGEHTSGDKGACSKCSDPDAGYYRTVNDAPIAEVDADTLIELLSADLDTEDEDEDENAEDESPEFADTPVEMAECCDTERPVTETRTAEIMGEKRTVCKPNNGCKQ